MKSPSAVLTGFLALLLLLVHVGEASAKLIPRRDARAGVMDASLVAVVRQDAGDRLQIEEVFLGESAPGNMIILPGFRLFTYQQYGDDIVESITPDTRILLFLQHKKDDPSAWEITAFGYCFFWVHDVSKVDDLRKIAKDAIDLRRSWEAARNTPEAGARVEALWPYLWNNDRLFSQLTQSELQKIGSVAGDYIARQFEELSHSQRMDLVQGLSKYGGSNAHAVLVTHLKKMEQAYESFILERSSEVSGAKALMDDWPTAPNELKEMSGEIFYGLAGLAAFKDRSDLSYIRELALWSLKYRLLRQTCDSALGAFEYMPEKANLRVISSICEELSLPQSSANPLTVWHAVMALKNHTYPEAVPLLVRFLGDRWGAAREGLTAIVGEDLGKSPKAWLDWYDARGAGRKLN